VIVVKAARLTLYAEVTLVRRTRIGHRGMKMPRQGIERFAAIGIAGFAAFVRGIGLVLAVGMIASAPQVRAAANPLRCDFDGDGRSDLAVGVPGDNNGRGAVNVQYSPDGFLSEGAYYLRPLNVPGASAAGQRLGSSLACGDFDNDGYADLAIGIPGESADRGAIVALYGSDAGLFNKFGTYFTQAAIPGQLVEAADRFGEALAAGDFNEDGRADLAIGVPGEDVESTLKGNIKDAGMVHVVFGFSGGLGLGPAQTFYPLTPGVCCVEGSAHYGAALAAGDFNEDGSGDLAIGAPYSEVTPVNQQTVKGAGAVHVILGQAGVGLFLPAGQAPLNQSILMATTPRTGELFGYSLAVGDFDGGRGDDLAIGAPFEKLEEDFKNEAFRGYGAVHVVYFSGVGLTISSSDMQMEDESSGLGDAWRDVDRFGFSLAAGNFDGLHSDDLAIGSPGNSDSGRGGAVAVIYSNGLALSVEKVQFFFPGDFADGIQTPPPPVGLMETDLPEFGGSLAVGDYQGDGVADLFIGVPGYTVDGAFKTDVGAVEIKPGSAGVGLGFSYLLLHQDVFQPNKTWSAAESNASFKAEFWKMTGERFGYAMGR
jgi:hypothetical protein